MNDKRNYAALKRTAIIEVDGGEIEIPKTGSIKLLEKLTRSALLEPFVRKLGELQVGGAKIDNATVKAELAKVAAEQGLSGADLVTSLPKILRDVVDELIVADAIVESEEHRATLRGWVEDFNEQELFVCVAGFLKTNVPTAYGPFVRMGGALLVQNPQSSAPVESSESSSIDASANAKAA